MIQFSDNFLLMLHFLYGVLNVAQWYSVGLGPSNCLGGENYITNIFSFSHYSGIHLLATWIIGIFEYLQLFVQHKTIFSFSLCKFARIIEILLKEIFGQCQRNVCTIKIFCRLIEILSHNFKKRINEFSEN